MTMKRLCIGPFCGAAPAASTTPDEAEWRRWRSSRPERAEGHDLTLQQALAFGLMGVTIAGFVWGRWRYDVIAVLALLAGVTLDIVPAKAAFDGFKNDITVIIACALIVSAAFAKSGIVEMVLRPLIPHLKTATSQVMLFAGAVTLLSMVTKNVGALAIMMPLALSVAKRTGTSPSCLLMPMSFGALLGGTVTLVGTSPNII